MNFEPLNPPHLPFKRCPQCGITFPRTTEFFGLKRSGSKIPASRCKGCAAKASKKSRAKLVALGPIQGPRKQPGKRVLAIPGEMKQCPICKNAYPFTPEFFYRNRAVSVGLDHRCKSCADRAILESRSKHWSPEQAEAAQLRRERKELKPQGLLRCFRCKEVKPASEFNEKSRKRLIRSVCYSCSGKVNPATIPDGHKRCCECKTILPLEKFSFASKQHRSSRCKPCASKRYSEYIKKHPEKARVINTRREARRRSLPDQFTEDDWQRAFDYFGGRCAVCDRQLTDLFGTHKPAADHWIPLSSPDCPGTVATNIIPLCHGVGGCNNSKSDRDAHEWLTATYGKRQANKIIARIEAYFDYVKEQAS